MTVRALYDSTTGEVVRTTDAEGQMPQPPTGCGVVDVTGCSCCSDLKQKRLNTATCVSGSTIEIGCATILSRGSLAVTMAGGGAAPFYKCNVCGNIVECVYLPAGHGDLVCCGDMMVLYSGEVGAKTESYWQCNVCHQVVEMRSARSGDLVCCGENMSNVASYPSSSILGTNVTFTVSAYDGVGAPRAEIVPYRLKVQWGPDTLVDEDGATEVTGTKERVVAIPATRPLRCGVEQPYSVVVMARPLCPGDCGGTLRVEVT